MVQIISPRRRADGSLSSIVFILFYISYIMCACACVIFFSLENNPIVLCS